MLKLMTVQEVTEAIPVLGTQMRDAQARIHLIAVSTLAHMRDSGDYRNALALMNALPNGTRVQALAAWYREFSSKKLALRQDAKTKEWKAEISKERKPEDFKVDAAHAVNFADFTKEVPPRTMGVTQLIAYLQKLANNTAKNDDGSPKVDEPTRALAAQMYKATTEKLSAPQVAIAS